MTVPPIISGFFTNIVKKKGEDVFNGITNIIKTWKVTPEQQEEIQKEINRHNEAELILAQQAEAMFLQDRQKARELQIEALRQDDRFSKRFIYFLAIGIILLTFAFNLCFFFIQYPERNHDIINMIAGTLNSTGFAAIIYFFFGSSKGSADKQNIIDKHINSNGN